MVHVAETREGPAGALIERWTEAPKISPAQSHTILAHTSDDVRMLNDMARDALKQGGQLDGETAVETLVARD